MGGGKWRGRGKGERWREGGKKGREREREAGREGEIFVLWTNFPYVSRISSAFIPTYSWVSSWKMQTCFFYQSSVPVLGSTCFVLFFPSFPEMSPIWALLFRSISQHCRHPSFLFIVLLPFPSLSSPYIVFCLFFYKLNEVSHIV